MGNGNINPEKLPGALQKYLKNAGNDGKISQQEALVAAKNGLTAKEAAELSSALSGKDVKVGDDVNVKAAKVQQKSFVENSREKGFIDTAKDWFNSQPEWLQTTEKFVGAGAVVVGAGTLIGLSAPVALTLGAVVGLASCSSGSEDPAYDIDIKNPVSVTVKVDSNSNSSDVVKFLEQTFPELMSMLNDIKNNQNVTNQRLDQIEAKLDEVVKQLVANGVKLDVIIDTLTGMGADMKTIIAKLEANGQTQKDIYEAITKLSAQYAEGNKELKYELDTIRNLIAQGNTIGKNNGDLLAEIYTELQALHGDTSVNAEKVRDVLNTILKAVHTGINQNKDMDTKTHQKLDTIIELLTKLNDKTDKYGQALGDKADQIIALLAQISKTGDNAGVDLKKLLDLVTKLVDKADKIDAKSQVIIDLMQKLLANSDKLGDQADAILEAIGNIAIGDVKVDLSKIENTLDALLKATKDNGKILQDIDSKIGIISFTVQGLMNAVNDDIKPLLQKILDKIPEGCKCSDAVLIEIKGILIEIKDKVKDNPKHEGILDDLDNLLG